MDELTGAQLIAESLKTQVEALKNTAKICGAEEGQSSRKIQQIYVHMSVRHVASFKLFIYFYFFYSPCRKSSTCLE